MTNGPTLDYSPPGRDGWTRKLAIGLAFYPLLLLASVYGTWLAVWAALGHRPRPASDSPARMGWVADAAAVALDVLLVGAWPAFSVYAVLVGSLYFRSLGSCRPSRLKTAVVAGVAILPWAAAFGVLEADPGGVLRWFGLEAP